MNSNRCEILLVEDSSADVELTIHALRKENLVNKIDVARDGEEALDYLFFRGAYSARPIGQPKLILLDLKLPKVSGIEVLREIKNNPTLKTIPIVVMTSSKEDKDVVESYKLGVNSYIQKPLDFDQFRETIRHIGMYWLVINQPPPRILEKPTP
ncbi:MAG: putative sensory transduction regulatory protein [Acidobacteriales bacterium]|nr:putative sensory transduction regulatory protein [Terriglobales bacterium]